MSILLVVHDHEDNREIIKIRESVSTLYGLIHAARRADRDFLFSTVFDEGEYRLAWVQHRRCKVLPPDAQICIVAINRRLVGGCMEHEYIRVGDEVHIHVIEIG